MGDSFFGFNTKLPPLSNDERRQFGDGGSRAQGGNAQAHGNRNTVGDVEVYDFEAMQNELEAELGDQDDRLGDQLIEEGDDFNDETFGGNSTGQDFDFAANTERFNSNLTDEETAFFIKRPVKEEQNRRSNARTPWSGPTGHSASPLGNRPISGDMRNSGNKHDNGRKYGESSPVTPSASIWGSFGGSLASDRGYGPLGGSPGGLSPFAGRPQSRQQPPQSYTPSPPPGLSPSSSFEHQQQQRRGQPVLLEDIEAELQRQATTGRFRQEHQRLSNDLDNGKKMLSLAEVEASMLASGHGARGSPLQQHHTQQLHREHAMAQFGGIHNPDPMQLMAIQQQQQLHHQQQQQQKEMLEQASMEREMNRRHNQRKSQYNGLMSQHDKDFINRIQLSQLASDDPFAEDFYYQVYSSLRQRAGLPTWPSATTGNDTTGRGRGRREETTMQRMQQQLQRIVNDAKRRPKQSQVSLEGALGKITSLTVRNPRQVLQVSDKKTPSTGNQDGSQSSQETQTVNRVKPIVSAMNDRRRILKIVENVYLIVLQIEQMRRQGAPQLKPGHEDEHEEAVEKWNTAYAEKVQKLWNTLRILDTPEGSLPLIISILSTGKGKKVIPRIVRYLSSDQNLTMVTVIIANFEQLQVCRHVIYPGTTVANAEEAKKQQFVTYEDVELFMNTAAPALLGFISEAPLRVINGLFHLFMEKNNVEVVSQSRPGLAFLAMLLSRAEILKQGGGALNGLAPPAAEELAQWQEAYGKLFSTLQGRYASIFPSLYYLVPIHPSMNMMQLSLELDDIYVWQFLAAMAVGASMEQQHILVTEVRDRVMENIVLAHSNRLLAPQSTHRIANVNLFLHALGLDASQVTVPR
ncbi:topoisomerase II-associated protein PAT1-domain-containing protein [Phycomyces nitens]|nr:topoisomerase II-associated protein PAT1-domain-containing protein [Phycomyces nitens]